MKPNSAFKAAIPGAAVKAAFVAVLAVLSLAAAGCRSTGAGLVDQEGNPLTTLDPVWKLVDDAFPGILEGPVTVRLIERAHSGFDIESGSILISRSYEPEVARGKVAMGLTHLALNNLSGGDGRSRGRCFDNDVRFLEYALATYMDRKAAGSMEKELPGSYAAAARLIESGGMSSAALRDWEVFCYRGRWADQYEEWNLEGLRALLTLGMYLVDVLKLRTEDLGLVFEILAGDYQNLDGAYREVFGADLGETLEAWQRHVLDTAPRFAVDGGAPGAEK
jgi:hypothetical protein